MDVKPLSLLCKLWAVVKVFERPFLDAFFSFLIAINCRWVVRKQRQPWITINNPESVFTNINKKKWIEGLRQLQPKSIKRWRFIINVLFNNAEIIKLSSIRFNWLECQLTSFVNTPIKAKNTPFEKLLNLLMVMFEASVPERKAMFRFKCPRNTQKIRRKKL